MSTGATHHRDRTACRASPQDPGPLAVRPRFIGGQLVDRAANHTRSRFRIPWVSMPSSTLKLPQQAAFELRLSRWVDRKHGVFALHPFGAGAAEQDNLLPA